LYQPFFVNIALLVGKINKKEINKGVTRKHFVCSKQPLGVRGELNGFFMKTTIVAIAREYVILSRKQSVHSV